MVQVSGSGGYCLWHLERLCVLEIHKKNVIEGCWKVRNHKTLKLCIINLKLEDCVQEKREFKIIF